MEIFAQFAMIAYFLTVSTFGFTLIGKTPEDENRYKGMALTTFVYGLFTLGIVLLWGTTNVVDLVAKLGLIAMLWGPIVFELPDIHKPFPTVTLKIVVNGFLLCAVRIAVIVAFWVY